MLVPLGVSQTDEELYRALLRTPGSSATQLAAAAGLSLAQVRAGLARMVAMRLVQRRGGRPAVFLPAPPDIAITALVNQRQTDLDRARLAVPELLAEYQRSNAASRPGSLLEVLTGPDVGHRRFRELQAAATQELLIFDRVSNRRVTGRVEVEAEAPMLSRGVRCRGIYETSSLGIPGRLPHIRRLGRLGEQSRVTPRLPMKMAICDRRLAMLPLFADEESMMETVVLVGPSNLLDALVEVFEVYWRYSVPIVSGGQSPPGSGPPDRSGTGLSTEEREVLDLLTTGLKDEAIARQLGTSMRTTRRRIASLLGKLGVATRFQAGVEARRRGLL